MFSLFLREHKFLIPFSLARYWAPSGKGSTLKEKSLLFWFYAKRKQFSCQEQILNFLVDTCWNMRYEIFDRIASLANVFFSFDETNYKI